MCTNSSKSGWEFQKKWSWGSPGLQKWCTQLKLAILYPDVSWIGTYDYDLLHHIYICIYSNYNNLLYFIYTITYGLLSLKIPAHQNHNHWYMIDSIWIFQDFGALFRDVGVGQESWKFHLIWPEKDVQNWIEWYDDAKCMCY